MSRVGVVSVSIVAALSLATPAATRADSWHAGFDLRVDPGTHPIRVGGGVELGRLDAMLVLDPMFWTDGQHDIDLFTTTRISRRGAGLLAGWRTSAIGIADGHQLQQKLLIGLSGPLPLCDSAALRMRWAFELATVIVKHGGGLPSEVISFESGRDFIDLVNFGMFVTIEYAGAL